MSGKKIFLSVVVLSTLVTGGLFLFRSKTSAPSIVDVKAEVSSEPSFSITLKTYTTLKNLTGQQMFELYDSFSYPNTKNITTPPDITGNPEADVHIRTLAEKRGYKLRSVPEAQILKKGLTALGEPFLLQYKASVDWDTLTVAAKNDGYNIGTTSAFRSIEDQRFLFMQAFNSAKIPVSKVTTGQYDKALDDIMALAAIPGYSRHHTGYTLDFSCDGGSALIFKNTRCYSWVSKNNFENVKKYGWIPSYPEGTPPQGPNPEPWEFVWVGKDVLYE